MSEPKAAAEERLARNNRALDLHLAGTSYSRIAEVLHVSERTARTAVKAALAARAGQSQVDEPTAVELARIDAMLMGLWPRARRGELDAVDRVLKLAERREKLATPRRNDHSLRKAFDESASTSKYIVPGLDNAIVEAGRTTVDQIDHVLATGTSLEVTKALYLLPHVMNTLREMLATPASRQAAGMAAQGAGGGRLAQLRAVHAQRTG